MHTPLANPAPELIRDLPATVVGPTSVGLSPEAWPTEVGPTSPTESTKDTLQVSGLSGYEWLTTIILPASGHNVSYTGSGVKHCYSFCTPANFDNALSNVAKGR